MNLYKRDNGRHKARLAGIPLDGDYFSDINSCMAADLAEIARTVKYRKPKNASGSTSRYFYEYLNKGK